MSDIKKDKNTDQTKNEQNKKVDNKKKGKKDEKKEEMSEEDLNLKQEFELLVERTKEADAGVQKLALTTIADQIRTSTSSMTSVPKPLKFLRHHFDTLKASFEAVTDADNKVLFADILSMLAMTIADDVNRESLKFKLQGSKGNIGVWGHEYVRHLAGVVGQEFQARANERAEKQAETSIKPPSPVSADDSDLMELVNEIVPFNMRHNAEADACDLLMEVDSLDLIVQHCDERNYSRVCLYLLKCADFSLDPEFTHILKVCYDIYQKMGKYPEALRVALRLDNETLVNEIFNAATDRAVQKQMAFIIGRHNYSSLETEDDEIKEIIGNTKLNSYYNHLATDLDSLEPKHPDDIYKSHLAERSNLPANVDSARQNLATSIVNAFVNAGYGTDKIMAENDNRWLTSRNKDHGKTSATAAMGMLYLWNVDEGLAAIDKFLYYSEAEIQGGALLGIGILNSGVRSEYDPACGLLSEYVENTKRENRIGAIAGLGLAYAGTRREDVLGLLMPILADSDQPIEVVSFTALSLGMIYVGSCNEDISATILQVLMERNETTLTDTLCRFLCLALGLLFLGKQDSAEAMIEATKTLSPKIAKFCETTIETCAFAGTGNVLKVQKLLQICGDHLEEGENNKHQAVAVLGIAMVAMGEDLSAEMATRSFDHLLQYGDPVIKRAVPLGLGLLNIGNPRLTVMDTLSKFSHDTDAEVAQSAIFALGLIGAGTNNARIAQMLRQLASYYTKDLNALFVVRIAQGLVFMGKGLISINPFHSDRFLMNPSAMAGILTVLHACLDMKNLILGKYHYFLYYIATAMYPRMLITVDDELNPLPVSVRVGTAVDTTAQAGRPKTITGFQTHNTPVLLQHEQRAELSTEKYLTLSSTLEGVVLVKKNPDYVEQ